MLVKLKFLPRQKVWGRPGPTLEAGGVKELEGDGMRDSPSETRGGI